MNRMMMPGLLFAALSWCAPAGAQQVRITSIPYPDFTEVQRVADGELVPVAELGKLPAVLPARQGEGGMLEFSLKGGKYRIARADVVLANQKLVEDACRTVPVTLSADARSASVKGAGEGCK